MKTNNNSSYEFSRSANWIRDICTAPINAIYFLFVLHNEYCTGRTYTRNRSGPALPLYQTNTWDFMECFHIFTSITVFSGVMIWCCIQTLKFVAKYRRYSAANLVMLCSKNEKSAHFRFVHFWVDVHYLSTLCLIPKLHNKGTYV